MYCCVMSQPYQGTYTCTCTYTCTPVVFQSESSDITTCVLPCIRFFSQLAALYPLKTHVILSAHAHAHAQVYVHVYTHTGISGAVMQVCIVLLSRIRTEYGVWCGAVDHWYRYAWTYSGTCVRWSRELACVWGSEAQASVLTHLA